MGLKKVWLGSVGPFLYNPEKNYQDGTPQLGIRLEDPHSHNLLDIGFHFISVASTPYDVGVNSEIGLFVDSASGNIQLNLPAISTSFEREFTIAKIGYDVNLIMVSAASGDFIEERVEWPLVYPQARMRLRDDGNVWRVMN